MLKHFLIFLFFVFSLFAGELQLIGKIRPGELVIGKAENILRVTLDNKQIQFDESDGLFVFGFDRDETGVHFLTVKFTDGSVTTRKFILPERKYKIQRINRMKQKYVTAPESELKRIDREDSIKTAAKSKLGRIDDALFAKGFKRPVKSKRLTGIFGSQRILNGIPKNAHNGVDYGVPTGTNVYAMTDGVVRLVADNFYYSGNFVLLDHGQGLNSFYLHLSKSNVKEGQMVKKGEKIGEVGSTGRSTGPHLHWGVQWFRKRVDPLSLLKFKFE